MTMTASVSVIAPGTGTPTGTVMFQDGGVTITGCAAQAVSAAGTAVVCGVVRHRWCAPDHSCVRRRLQLQRLDVADPHRDGQPGRDRNGGDLVGGSVGIRSDLIYTAIVTATAPAAGTPTER